MIRFGDSVNDHVKEKGRGLAMMDFGIGYPHYEAGKGLKMKNVKKIKADWKNLEIDIGDIIQNELFQFFKREPDQLRVIDPKKDITSYCMFRGCNLAAKKIMSLLKEE